MPFIEKIKEVVNLKQKVNYASNPTFDYVPRIETENERIEVLKTPEELKLDEEQEKSDLMIKNIEI